MIHVYPDNEALMRGAAELFVDQATRSALTRGRFNIALAGGTTPKRAYELLAQEPFRDRVDWSRVFVFWGDERCVPPDDALSNYRAARMALLDQVPIPAGNVHRIRGELPPAESACDYETALVQHFGPGPVRFDLIILGLGRDGHTASLFPGTPVIHERTRLAAEVYLAESNMWRVTLTVPVLSAATVVAFVVSGAAKADVVHEVILGPRAPDRLPAQFVLPAAHETRWLVDQAAASSLPAPAHASNREYRLDPAGF